MRQRVSRREFVLGTACALVAARTTRALRADLSAQQIVDRIRANVGVPWKASSSDGVKAGAVTTPVTGVATTVMATIDVLRRAAAAGQNFVITQEPVFYALNDEAGNRATDPVYLAKKAFVDEHRLVVFRFADHWSARQPNDAVKALAGALGWSGKELAGADQMYQVPETTLGALIADVRRRLGLRGGLRVVGQPTLTVRTVFVSPGTTTVPMTTAALRRADVIVTGEPREWEAVPYVLDTWAAHAPKGMIHIGRVVSEEPGMQACAKWIKSFTPEVPVEHIASADPYWSPAS